MISAIIARLGLDAGPMRSQLKSITSEAKSAGSEIAGALGISISIGGVIAAGKAVIDYAGNLRDASDSIGVNVEALQELRQAFGESGVSGEQLDKALVKLQQSQQDARDGSEKAIASFESLGVSWEEIVKLSPDELLMRIADGMRDAKDPTAALSAAMDIMGKSGARMAAGLKQGSAGIRELREEAKKLSEDEVNSLDNAGDSLTRLGNALKVIGARTVNAFVDGKDFVDQVDHVLARLGIGKEKHISDSVSPAEERAARDAVNARKAGKTATPEDPRVKELNKQQREQFADFIQYKTQLEEGRLKTEREQFIDFRKFQMQETEKAKKEEARLDAELAKDREEALKNQIAEGVNRFAEAQREKQDRREALKGTLGEIAADPGNPAGAKARRAQRWEERAQRAGRRGREAQALALHARAEEIKGGILGLKESEKDKGALEDALNTCKPLLNIETNTAKLGVNL